MKMAQLSSSNKSEDIATLAYIWGVPLLVMEENANYFTNPNTPPGLMVGPWNTMIPARELANASFNVPGLTPNDDTLYDFAWLHLKLEPLVLKVPPIPDRYYTLQFDNAYGGTFAYVGSRTTGSGGGTYLITGPDWNRQVPSGMTQIKSPTNLAWIQGRILVKGASDVPNVNAIQDQISLKPLSAFQGNKTSKPLSAATTTTKEIPIRPDPALIPNLGIKVYDEISQGMIGNPASPPDPQLVTKFASIGIGPGKTPSTEDNDTIKTSLQTGITEGQKMINAKWSNVGTLINGWFVVMDLGNYGTNYLLRAAATQFACCANIAQEALYPIAHADAKGNSFSGANNYTIHFNPGQTPPVKAFWSITMYNNKSLFVNINNNIGNEEVKVYWSAFDERDSMTINAHSAEYLDLFAIVDGEPSEIFNNLSENISKLKSYINSEKFTDTSLRQSLNARIEALSARYKSAEDIPRIITQSANYGWRIPGESYYLPVSEAETSRHLMVNGNIPIEMIKHITRVIVTSENARRSQEYITILDKPADVIGTAIRL
jgi:hypothetical protein